MSKQTNNAPQVITLNPPHYITRDYFDGQPVDLLATRATEGNQAGYHLVYPQPTTLTDKWPKCRMGHGPHFAEACFHMDQLGKAQEFIPQRFVSD